MLRRCFIDVLSHPDSGKPTLTETRVLHALAIDPAGEVHGERGPACTASPWLETGGMRGQAPLHPNGQTLQ